MRRRVIDPSIWTNYKFASLNIRQRLLYIGLISNANDYGKVDSEAMAIKARIFPSGGITVKTIRADLERLQKKRLLCLYSVEGKLWGHFPAWDEWQTIPRKYQNHLPDCPKETHYGLTIACPKAAHSQPIACPKAAHSQDQEGEEEGYGKGKGIGKGKRTGEEKEKEKVKEKERLFLSQERRVKALTNRYRGIKKGQVGVVDGVVVVFPHASIHQEQVRENPYEWKVMDDK